MIYFTGCTHFGHEKIIPLANRPFEDVVEMDNTLIRNWCKIVKDDDTIIHLGDVGWTDESIDYMRKLPGKKLLIAGNHDHSRVIKKYVRDGVELLPPIHEVELPTHRFVLSHYPIEDWNKRYRGSIHLHCHTHSPNLRNASIPRVSDSSLTLPNNYPAELKCNRFCVGVDSTGFAPISIEDIIAEAYR